MLKTTGLSQNGDYAQDINGMRVDRRSQRVRKIFGEVIPSPSATVTEKLAAATIQARDSSHATMKVQFDNTVPAASHHSQSRFSQPVSSAASKPHSSQKVDIPSGSAQVVRNSLPASSASFKGGFTE